MLEWNEMACVIPCSLKTRLRATRVATVRASASSKWRGSKFSIRFSLIALETRSSLTAIVRIL